MAFLLTGFVIVAVRDFWRELLQIYLRYIVEGRDRKDSYFYMQKTILIKGLSRGANEKVLLDGINSYLTENMV